MTVVDWIGSYANAPVRSLSRACGEIATAADVKCLGWSRFTSRDYQDSPQEVYDEGCVACPRTMAPILRDVD